MAKQVLSNQSEWVASNFNNLADPETPLVWYTDPKTGDIYNSNEEYTDLIASGKAINNPDFQYLGLYPTKAMDLYDLQTTDPKSYYNQLSKNLGDTAYNYYGRLLKEYQPITEQIESLKTKSPQDYFNTKFELLSKQIGWNTGFGESGKNDAIANELKSLIPEAKAAGFNDNQINSIITNNINTGSIDSQNRIAHQKAGSTSNFWKENLTGTAKTAAIMGAIIAGGTGLEYLMTPGAAGVGGATGAGGLTGGGAFVPTAGSGASFTIAPEAAYTVAGGAGGAAGVTATPGANAVLNSSTNIANLTPPGAGNFGSIVAPSANAVTNGAGLTGGIGAGTMVGDGTLGTTIGQTYMAAAPGQFAVDASGAAIPAGASGIAGTIPSSGISASDVLRNVNRAKSIANALTSGKTGQQSINPSALASLLTSPQEQFGGLYRMNEKPFLSTQQTASLSPDSYNVSGQNINSPIAPTNQLLANLLYPKA